MSKTIKDSLFGYPSLFKIFQDKQDLKTFAF